MVKGATERLVLRPYGKHLGRGEGCFEVRMKDESGKYRTVETYPLYERNIISEAILYDGNTVSTSALESLVKWNIFTLIVDEKGMPVGVLLNINDFSHVKTRLSQYEATFNDKALYIAKHVILSKIRGQKMILNKFHLEKYKDNIESRIEKIYGQQYRSQIMALESQFSKHYFSEVFSLFPEKLRPKSRITKGAIDGVNNIFNFAYTVLLWREYRAILKAKLEPYLGYLHSTQFGKPSLICDLIEPYRYLIDDFLLNYWGTDKKGKIDIHKGNFIWKTEFWDKHRCGRRIFLRDIETHGLFEALDEYFDKKMIDIPRIKIGKRSSLQTLMNEEGLLFAKFLRGERDSWVPRLPSIY